MSDIHTDSTVEPSDMIELKRATFSADSVLFRTDPRSLLPLNSDLLADHIATILADLEIHIEEEKREAFKLQKQVAVWEERIRGNYFQMGKNVDQIKNNLVEAEHDIMHRDYWWAREHHVLTDFSLAKSAARPSDWAWVIKKYGLKSVEGSPLDHHTSCIEEVCLGAIRTLAIEYNEAGVRYDLAQNYKKAENDHLTSLNAKLSAACEHLRSYIHNVHTSGIAPIQDGILFFKEFALKLKSFEQQQSPATFGDMRAWAEDHLDQFLKKYPSMPYRVASAFRRLASIPLPAQNS